MARVGTGELHAWFWWKRPEKMRPLGKPRCRWEDNINVDLREVEWGMNWIDLPHDTDRWRAFVSAVMNRSVPSNSGNLLTSLGRVGFS